MLTELQVIERLRAACIAAGGQKAFAKAHDLTPGYVHDVLHSKRAPAERILAAIGIERITMYQEIGDRSSDR